MGAPAPELVLLPPAHPSAPQPFLSRGGALVKQPELCCGGGSKKAAAPEESPHGLLGHPAAGVLNPVTNRALQWFRAVADSTTPTLGFMMGGLITPKRRLKPTFNLSTGLGAVLSGRSHGKGVPRALP